MSEDYKQEVADAADDLAATWRIPPAVAQDADPEKVTFLGKVRRTLKGMKTLIVAAVLLAVSSVAAFDPSLLPLDSIVGIFVSDEAKVPAVVGMVTLAFTILRFVSPGLMAGLSAINKD